MAITYPLTPPDGLKLSSLSWRKRRARGVQVKPYTFGTKVYASAGQAWAIEAVIPLMTVKRSRAVRAFLTNALEGEQTFIFGPNVDGKPSGRVANRLTLVNGSGQSGNSLIVDGFKPNTEQVVAAGDYFSLNGKLYEATADADSDNSGQATLEIWPNLRAEPADNDELNFYNPVTTFVMLSATDTQYDANAHHQSITFTAIEKL